MNRSESFKDYATKLFWNLKCKQNAQLEANAQLNVDVLGITQVSEEERVSMTKITLISACRKK